MNDGFVIDEWPALAAQIKRFTDEDPGYLVPPGHSRPDGLPPKSCILVFEPRADGDIWAANLTENLRAAFKGTRFHISCTGLND